MLSNTLLLQNRDLSKISWNTREANKANTSEAAFLPLPHQQIQKGPKHFVMNKRGSFSKLAVFKRLLDISSGLSQFASDPVHLVCEEVPHPLCVSFSRFQIQNLLVGSWSEQTVCLCMWALPVFIPWSNIFFAAQLTELLKVASGDAREPNWAHWGLLGVEGVFHGMNNLPVLVLFLAVSFFNYLWSQIKHSCNSRLTFMIS